MDAAAPPLTFIREKVLPLLGAPLATLLVGSHAEGHATPASDIDLVAVVQEGQRARVRTREMEVGGRIVGVTFIAPSQLRRRIDRLDTIYRTGGHVVDTLATRMAEAIVVDDIGAGRALVELARRYVPSRGTLHEIARVALTFYQDALGSLEVGDHESAVLMARQAATIGVDCFLLRHGFRSLRPKWHLHRLREAGADRLLAHYRRVQGLAGDRESVHAVLVFAELDRLMCAVLQIADIRDFERSPLWANA